MDERAGTGSALLEYSKKTETGTAEISDKKTDMQQKKETEKAFKICQQTGCAADSSRS